MILRPTWSRAENERINKGLVSGLRKQPMECLRQGGAPLHEKQALGDQVDKGTHLSRCQSTSFPSHLSANSRNSNKASMVTGREVIYYFTSDSPQKGFSATELLNAQYVNAGTALKNDNKGSLGGSAV